MTTAFFSSTLAYSWSSLYRRDVSFTARRASITRAHDCAMIAAASSVIFGLPPRSVSAPHTCPNHRGEKITASSSAFASAVCASVSASPAASSPPASSLADGCSDSFAASSFGTAGDVVGTAGGGSAGLLRRRLADVVALLPAQLARAVLVAERR